jgi:hypothetical protein
MVSLNAIATSKDELLRVATSNISLSCFFVVAILNYSYFLLFIDTFLCVCSVGEKEWV